ncbi:hypothetical protein JYT86_00065 [bacterium AH-315-N03]|nr:hypothetical protein [bacterium AH-315-N03]
MITGGPMRAFLLALTFCFAAAPGVASAQDPPECHTVRPGLIECSETQIYGTRPRSFFLLSRTHDVYEPPELRRADFARSVRRTVRRTPF